MSAPSLCSAFAIALSSTLRMIRAPFFGENASTSSARPTGMPRMRSATSRPFWADRRTPRNIAVVSISRFPFRSLFLLLDDRCGDLLVARVTLEGTRQRELAELVPDHVLGHVHRDVLLAVVDGDRQADEVRRDRRAPAPGLDRLLVRGRARRVHLVHQVAVDERALLDRACHALPLLLRAATDDHHVRTLVLASLVALGRRAPGRHRVVASATAVRAAPHRVVHRVHRDAAHRRTDPAPPVGTRLADRAQAVLLVADLADRRAAIDVHLADLARAKPQLRVDAFAREQLHRSTRRTRELRAAT